MSQISEESDHNEPQILGDGGGGGGGHCISSGSEAARKGRGLGKNNPPMTGSGGSRIQSITTDRRQKGGLTMRSLEDLQAKRNTAGGNSSRYSGTQQEIQTPDFHHQNEFHSRKSFERGLHRTQEELHAKAEKRKSNSRQQQRHPPLLMVTTGKTFERGLHRSQEEREAKARKQQARRREDTSRIDSYNAASNHLSVQWDSQEALRRTQQYRGADSDANHPTNYPRHFDGSELSREIPTDPVLLLIGACPEEEEEEESFTTAMEQMEQDSEYDASSAITNEEEELRGADPMLHSRDNNSTHVHGFQHSTPITLAYSSSSGAASSPQPVQQPQPTPDGPVNISDSNLVVAIQVEDDDDSSLLLQAVEVDPRVLERRAIERKKNKECILVGLAFIVGSLTILFGTIFGRHRSPTTPDKDSIDLTLAPSAAPSLAPSEPPSYSPSGALELLLESLPENTLENLETFGTPQWKAWDWLTNHHTISNLEWRKKQLFALATIYYSFEGENWYEPIRERWMDYEKGECLWFSSGFGYFDAKGEYKLWSTDIQIPPCNDGEEFTALQLDSLQLSGLQPSIPPEISLLSSLSTIKLGRNDINAPVAHMFPSELGHSTNLTAVNFAYNYLTGTMPREVGLMTTLTSLIFTSNALVGQLPSELGLITSLTELYLASNALTGPPPSELGLMTSLSSFILSYSALTGQLPSEMGLMTSLTRLHLEDNALSGQLPSELALMTSLELLHLYDNTLTGQLPSELGLMTSLKELHLGNNALTSQLPSEVGLMTSLTWLSLRQNALTGQLPSELGLMTSLTRLYLNENVFTGIIPTELIALTSATSVSLQGNGNFTLPTEIGLLTDIIGHWTRGL